MQMKNYLKREKGSMAVYTIASILSFIIILTGIFFTAASVRKNQLRTLMKIKEVYGKTVSTRRNIYDEKTAVEDTDAYIKDGLILHYDAINNTGAGHSNNTTTWKDLSGNGNDGTLLGFDSTSGWTNNYLKFDGVDDYVLSTNNLGLSGDTALTMCAVAAWDGDSWLSDWPSYMGITSASSYAGLSMTMNGGQPALDFWNYRYRADNALSVKQIYQICLVKETGSINTTSKIYVNGQEVAGTGNSTSSPSIVNSQAVVGRLDSTRWANARIYNIKYYNRALTDEEILKNHEIDKQRYQIVDDTDYVSSGLITHYDAINNTGTGYSNTATTWKDLSGNGNDGTLLGFDSSSGWKNNYLKFDGVDDYVLSTNNLGISGDTALTMCAVAAWDGDSWLSDWPSYMGITSASSYAGLSMTMNGGQPALDFWNYRYRADNALSVKQIYQICLVKETGSINTTSKIYVNGQEVAGTGNSTSSPSIVNSQAVVGRLDSTRWANARIYNIKYYNRALSQSEIQKNYAIDQQRYGF